MYNKQASASSTQNIPTDNTVSLLVSQIFSMNEGEPVGTVISKSSGKTVISVTDGDPLGAAIPIKVKSKIWSDEFIDLRCLFPHHEENPLTLVISPGMINLQKNT